MNTNAQRTIGQNALARFALLTLASRSLLLALPAAVQAQFNYTTNNGSITITRYTGAGGDVTIPDTINGLPVTVIGRRAFERTSLTTITIPGSITSIEGRAFSECGALTSVAIPHSVTNLGEWAFYRCVSIKNITVGNGVVSLGDYVFHDCWGVTSVVLGSGVTSFWNTAFYGCSSLRGVYFEGNAPSYQGSPFSSAGVLTIYRLAAAIGWDVTFAGRPVQLWDPGHPFTYALDQGTITITGYTSSDIAVTIPDTITGLPVTSIGNSAFSGQSSLTSVALSDSVTSIGRSAFGSCSGLTSITIPHSVTNVGDSPFGNCENLVAITVDVLNPTLSSTNGVLFNKDQTTLIQCPAGIIGDYLVPDSVSSILHEAFYRCGNLTNVTLGKGVSSIGRHTFSGCTNLAITVDPLNSNYTVADGALINKAQAELVLCPEGKSGSYAVPSGVTSIGWGAFGRCSSLTNVTIANCVTSIGSSAFYGCTSLAAVTIPNSVTNIGIAAFYLCASLTSVTIPNSVTAMGPTAFGGCAKLHSVYFQGNAPSTGGSWTFSYPTVYYLPGTSGWGPTFSGRPTAPWLLPNPVILTLAPHFGVQTNQFGFRVSWATNVPVVVETCTNLAAPDWSSVSTNNLTGGWGYFSDPEWTNHPSRIYRVRSE